MTSHAHHVETSLPLGGCDLRSCRHVRELLGGPAQWCATHIRTRPRRPRGAATCATVATFVSSWEGQRSDVLRKSERDLADPGGAAIRATVATFVSSWVGQRRDALTHIRSRPRRPWEAAICEAVATFVSSWEGQRSDVLRTSDRDLAVPGGGGARRNVGQRQALCSRTA